MLIDAGNNEDGILIANYIKKLNISKINYLIGTHIHEDHIGGLDNIINNFEIENIFLPYTSENVNITKTYEDVLKAIINKNLSVTKVEIGKKFNVGNASCNVVYVDNSEPEDVNDQSICIRMVFDEQSYLFMGDAGNAVEGKIEVAKTNLLKVGHHGSNGSTSSAFLEKVSPQLAVISVGKDNDYGHPNSKTLTRIKKYTDNIYRTDESGTIFIISNRKNKYYKQTKY